MAADSPFLRMNERAAVMEKARQRRPDIEATAYPSAPSHLYINRHASYVVKS